MGLIASNKAHKVGKLYFLNNSKNNIQTVPPKKKKNSHKNTDVQLNNPKRIAVRRQGQ